MLKGVMKGVMKPWIVILLTAVIVVAVIVISRMVGATGKSVESFTNKPIIWMYWEDKDPTKKRPAYLDLCYETVAKHCQDSFEIILLNQHTVFKYLPETRKDLDSKCSIPQKTDYYRYQLLHKYGGIWLDTDIIVMKNLTLITDKLAEGYEYVGAGCHGNKCSPSGFPKPSNWLMASNPHGKLMARCIQKADKILDANETIKDKYFIIGREIMWDEINYLLKNDATWRYYHLPSICSERDSNDNKYINQRMISTEDNDSKCSGKQLFVPIYNTAPGFPQWFKSYSRAKILDTSSNLLISKLFRESLRI